jgi:hypothetical protein
MSKRAFILVNINCCSSVMIVCRQNWNRLRPEVQQAGVWARKASLVGGSPRDVQAMAGHASLTTTSRYIEADSEAHKKLVNI